MIKRPLTVSVKQRALVARISRALKKQNRELKTDRSNRHVNYFIVNEQARIEDFDINLEVLGRKLGVLRPWEKLADD
jgi:hypothetical protein